MGVLSGLRIIELAGIGPAPFASMMLADHGAEVVCVERPLGNALKASDARHADVLSRSRRSIALDLKAEGSADVVKAIVRDADGLIEGFRPGVMERLGLGPEQLLQINPRLVYGRMTGWGQTGPLAARAGHDINYIAISGVLHAIGTPGGKPVVPLNLVGDFGAGGLLLAFGMLAAILSARTTGKGQVVDCAMTDGSALLMTMMWGLRGQGIWQDERGCNMLDGAAHFYDTYETLDGKAMAVGAIEPAFQSEFMRQMGLEPAADFAHQMDPTSWQVSKAEVAAAFRTRTRQEWVAHFEASDCCVTPVLSMEEALRHPHNQARAIFIDVAGIDQPAPAPRFSAQPAGHPVEPGPIGADTDAVLMAAGYDVQGIQALRSAGVVY